VFDTAGHERFHKINSKFFKSAKGIMLVYDISDKNTFDNITTWMKSIIENSDKTTDVLIIGNKKDIKENRQVSEEEGTNIANEYKVSFIETSAKTGENVENAFTTVINNYLKKEKEKSEENKKEENTKEEGKKEEVVIKQNEELNKNNDENNNEKLIIAEANNKVNDNKINSNENPNQYLKTEIIPLKDSKDKKNKSCFCN